MLCYISYVPVFADWLYVGGTLSKLSQIIYNSALAFSFSRAAELTAQPEVKA